MTSARNGLVILVALSGGCGSTAVMPGGGSAGAAGSSSAAGSGGHTGGGGPGGGGSEPGIPPVHRVEATACSPASSGFFPPSDAGVLTCATDSDCQTDAGFTAYRYCLQHTCSVDQCFTDVDCASGEACGCWSEFRGNAIHTNGCVPSTCRIDADCGAGGLCSPADTGYCGGLAGYHCRSAADTCSTDTSCSGNASLPSCKYAPEVGHWQCAGITVCRG